MTGTYWIATDGGVCRFNPNGHASRHSASDRTQTPSVSDKPSAVGAELMFVVYHPSQQEDANRVNALIEDPSGAIWCATYAGLYRLQPGANVAFQLVDLEFPRNTYQGRLVNNLALGGDGTLWIAARQGLFRRLHDGRTERYSAAQGLPDKDNHVETVFQDHTGRWWIGTRGRGFCSVVNAPEPGQRVTSACYSTVDGLPGNDVRSIFQSSTGGLGMVGTKSPAKE